MSLLEVGQKLKSARENKGLSLGQIYERTKIPMNHLDAIDNGQSDDLPEPVYVASFIKRYAQCIGLDGDLLVQEYRQDSSVLDNGKQKSYITYAPPVFVKSHDFNAIRINNKPPTYKTFLFPFLLIVIILFGVAWFAREQSNGSYSLNDPNIASLKETTSHLSKQTDTNQNANQPDKQPGEATANTKQLSLSANKHVWVEVKAMSTGENLLNGFLETGDRRDFQDSEGLRILAGNGGSLSVDFRGKIESFGQAGQKTERTFVFDTPHAISETTSASEKTADSTSQDTSAAQANKPVKTWKKTADSQTKSNARGGVRRLYEDSGRQYLPGESLGSHSIEVPYRDDN